MKRRWEKHGDMLRLIDGNDWTKAVVFFDGFRYVGLCDVGSQTTWSVMCDSRRRELMRSVVRLVEESLK